MLKRICKNEGNVETTDANNNTVLSDAIPQVNDLTGSVHRLGEHAIACGGFADVWKAIWSKQSGTTMVRMLSLRK